MGFKRALVVDDSKSARISLKRLLEEQDLEVLLAESGEEAITLLRSRTVDVIFMDHTMPGMDGLEALSAIKSNPLTATIPVMMYTTKEGEVYVSQARALGAIGVLPKQFQPHVLFDMLLELGLVTDRRLPASSARPAGTPATNDDADGQQALGMSLQTLVSRVLEDQHLALQADILQSHREFARQVAAEVYRQQRADELHEAAESDREEPAQKSPNQTVVSLLMVGLTAVAIVLGVLYARSAEEVAVLHEQLIATNARLDAAEKATALAIASAVRVPPERPMADLLETLSWAMNQEAEVPFEQPAFNGNRAAQLQVLLNKLATAGFRGTVRLEAHLGSFCLVTDDTGAYQVAPAELPLEECALIGHPLDESSILSERQSEAFLRFLETSNPGGHAGISLQLLAHDALSSVPAVAYPESAQLAGIWNDAARHNNRVELTLIPAGAGQ